MQAVDSCLRHYIKVRGGHGASHKEIHNELAELHIEDKRIRHAFSQEKEVHYLLVPKRISEDELLEPLSHFVIDLLKYTKPDRKRLLAAVRKAGWSEAEFDKACRRVRISPKTFRKLKRKA
jgi:hypothetical protein